MLLFQRLQCVCLCIGPDSYKANLASTRNRKIAKCSRMCFLANFIFVFFSYAIIYTSRLNNFVLHQGETLFIVDVIVQCTMCADIVMLPTVQKHDL